MINTRAGKFFWLIIITAALITGCQPAEEEPAATQELAPTTAPTIAYTDIPKPTPEPAPVHLEGSEKTYQLPFCFDFDTGKITLEPEFGCDVFFLKDEGSLTISFRSGSIGGWLEVEENPQPSDCLAAQTLSGRSLFPEEENVFVCYVTNKGRIGYLAVGGVEESSINLEFHTFRMLAPDFSPSVELAKYSSFSGVALSLPGCYDLDDGLVLGMDHPLCDLKLFAGEGAGSVNLEAFAPAGAAFVSAFEIEPTIHDCMDLDTYSSVLESVSPVGYYLCYKTAEGRFGYIAFDKVEQSKVEFSWTTYALPSDVVLTSDPIEELPTIEITGDSLAEFVEDVTIPDGTDFNPGETFTKTWRLLNAGEDTWTTDYRIVFIRGDQMSAPDELNLVQEVPPGETIDISVVMVAPADEAAYIGYWLLKDSDGNLFGVSDEGDPAFWVQIRVLGTGEPTPTVDPAATDDPDATPFPTQAPSGEDLVITGFNLTVDPVDFQGTCPTTITVSGSIFSTGAGTYLFSLEAGTSTSGFTFSLPGATTAEVTNDGQWDFSYVLDFSSSVEGWFWIHVEGDQIHDSDQVSFKVVCE